jgi:CBS domain-containing protein
MLACPKVCAPDVSVAQARELFGDDHVHALLVVRAGVLLAVVERADLTGAPGDAPALGLGRLTDRVVGPHADLLATRDVMVAGARRRLAVVDREGTLLGLLCLKRSGRGFCSQADVDARARELAVPVAP